MTFLFSSAPCPLPPLLSFPPITRWCDVPPLLLWCSVVMIGCIVDYAAESYDTCKSCFNDIVDTLLYSKS